jgi:hypothetical protein
MGFVGILLQRLVQHDETGMQPVLYLRSNGKS